MPPTREDSNRSSKKRTASRAAETTPSVAASPATDSGPAIGDKAAEASSLAQSSRSDGSLSHGDTTARSTKARSAGRLAGGGTSKRGQTAPLKVYLAFAESDTKLALELRDQLQAEKTVEVIDFAQCQLWYTGAADVDQLYKLVGQSDAFVLIHTANTVSHRSFRRLRQEYGFALHHANNAFDPRSGKPKRYPLVRVIYEDLPPEQIPGELVAFRPIDYRDPHSLELSLDSLMLALRDPENPPTSTERMEYVFREALGANPRHEMYTRVLRAEFERAFAAHVGPLSLRISQLAELTRAQDNLMTPEVISIKEANAFDDIWVVSHSLHNDLYTKDISESIAANLTKGIRYSYFVPHTHLIVEKIGQFREKFAMFCDIGSQGAGLEAEASSARSGTGRKRQGGFAFYYLDAGVFMPFDELVVYDGENPIQRWGYIQMRYDLTSHASKSDGLIMKIPDRTLNTIDAFLLRYKETHQPALLVPESLEMSGTPR